MFDLEQAKALVESRRSSHQFSFDDVRLRDYEEAISEIGRLREENKQLREENEQQKDRLWKASKWGSF